MNQETIVIVIEDGETHTSRTNRKVNVDIASLISDPKDGVDEMLADFQRDFSVEERKQEEPKQKRGRKRLEPVSLRAENVEIKMSDRERTCRVCSSQNL